MEPLKAFFEIAAKNIDGILVNLSSFKGKKAFIVVNVASAWGFTKNHYKELMELYTKFGSNGLEILAFPCNQFGEQESSCEADIKNLVQNTYGVTFPMFSKIWCNGSQTHDLYKYLKTNSELYDAATNTTKDIPWNFAKFLLDSNGKVLKFYSPKVKPSELAPEVEKLLKD